MGTSIYGIGLTGLAAAQAGLATTSHNIANASTPGYNRQRIIQGTNIAQFTGSGYFGQGTRVETVQRIYSDFLTGQARDAQTQSSQLDTYYTQIRQIDSMLADPASGLSPALQEFFNGVQDVATSPSSVAARQSLISGAQSLVAQFQGLNSRLQDIRDGVNSQVEASVASINAYAQQIARVNDNIALASGNGQPPNDLLDQRDELIAGLNKQVRVTVLRQDDGSLNVFVGNGQALVVGNAAYSLRAVQSPLAPGKTEVAYVSGPTVQLLGDTVLSGGELGGALAFRSQTLDSAQNSLGRIAIGMATAFNAQHQLGQDLNGVLGAAFFGVASPAVSANNANAGTAVVSAAISNVAGLGSSDYTLKYDGTNYTLKRASDGNTWTFASFPQTVDGVTLSIASGAAAAGDQFLIRPTINGARDIGVLINDTAKVAAAAPIRSAAAGANTGTATISAGSVNAPPPPNANLQQPVTITFTGAGTFSVSGTGTGNPAGLAYTAGGSISYNGWTVQISGTPAAGDSFTIGPNTAGVGDNRNALALGALQSQRTLIGGTASYDGAYAQLVSDVGNKTREMQVTSTAQANLVAQTNAAQQAVSGVNLDEEAANMLRYQQAYQASGKLMQVADSLFNTLLSLGRTN